MDTASEDCDMAVLRWAFNEAMLVLMIWGMVQSFR
jgi:hypothetical protein